MVRLFGHSVLRWFGGSVVMSLFRWLGGSFVRWFGRLFVCLFVFLFVYLLMFLVTYSYCISDHSQHGRKLCSHALLLWIKKMSKY